MCKAFKGLRPEQDGWHFAEDIFKYIFFKENHGILIENSLEFITGDSIGNKAMKVLAWFQTADKPWLESVMMSSLRYIYASSGLYELKDLKENIVPLNKLLQMEELYRRIVPDIEVYALVCPWLLHKVCHNWTELVMCTL